MDKEKQRVAKVTGGTQRQAERDAPRYCASTLTSSLASHDVTFARDRRYGRADVAGDCRASRPVDGRRREREIGWPRAHPSGKSVVRARATLHHETPALQQPRRQWHAVVEGVETKLYN